MTTAPQLRPATDPSHPEVTGDETVVVVGASLAGWRAAEALRDMGHRGRIVVLGAETHAPYDRPPLSKRFLTGKIAADDTRLAPGEGKDLELRLGTTATGLDLDARRVAIAGGETVAFDALVIATGAHVRTLGRPTGLAGVHHLRTIDDAAALRVDLLEATRVAVVGAGFIGLEVASSARAMGLEVAVVEVAPVPLVRSVGIEIGGLVADWHREHGVDVRLGAELTGIVGSDRVEGVRLAPPASGGSGELIPADVVVIGVGVAPNTGWLEGSGVDLDDGVLTDSRLRVMAGGATLPHVVAAGDVARWHHPGWGETARVEHWTNAAEQGQAAAATLVNGDDAPEFAPVPYFWSDQFDRKIQMVGRMRPGDELAVVDGSIEERRFAAAYGRDGRLTAAIGFGRPARVMALQRQIAAGAAFPPVD